MSSSPPSGRRITVRSISCRGVKAFVPFQKPPLYAAVSLAGRREKTPADPGGGENPDWDGAVFGFDLDGDGGLLQFEVKAQVPLLGNKLVGTICVPLSHLCSGGGDSTVPRRVSYQVLAPDGKPNGSLSFVCAVTGGAPHSYQQPQVYAARPEQDASPCCAPPPPLHSLGAYPPPATPYFEQQGSSYPPPPVSTSLYPPLQDMLPPSNYAPPPPRMIDSLFPVSNSGPNGSYPVPPTLTTAYPPPPASCEGYSVPPTQHISNYPPRYSSNPPSSAYPPQAQMNHEFPAPINCYPPPPPESSSILPRSTSSLAPRSIDRESPYMASSFQDSGIVTYPESHGPRVPSSGSYYPPSGIRHQEDGASSPYYYTHPGPGYSHG